ncbi:MAG: peptidoglycan-binding protein [Rivularia sp. (in: Bacteria)]|nr:peptidoglycan-binding protein [Rivularia sp. MS3]
MTMTTATATATANLPLLKKGDSGDSVRFLEQLLSSIYWFSQKPNAPILITENVKFDGVYDEQCQQIVKEFQVNYNSTFPAPAPNIAVDGEVGEQTWKALGDAIFRYTYL